jgi:HD-like signal output (HDOD) protein
MICRREFRERGETAYAAGLLHDLGIIVEHQFLSGRFEQVLHKCHTEKRNLSVVEREALGYDHTDVGMALGDDWELPEDLVAALGYHHKPEKAPTAYKRLVSIVHVADRFCQNKAVGYSDHPFEDAILLQAPLRQLKLEPCGLDLIFEDVKQELSKMEESGLL